MTLVCNSGKVVVVMMVEGARCRMMVVEVVKVLLLVLMVLLRGRVEGRSRCRRMRTRVMIVVVGGDIVARSAVKLVLAGVVPVSMVLSVLRVAVRMIVVVV